MCVCNNGVRHLFFFSLKYENHEHVFLNTLRKKKKKRRPQSERRTADGLVRQMESDSSKCNKTNEACKTQQSEYRANSDVFVFSLDFDRTYEADGRWITCGLVRGLKHKTKETKKKKTSFICTL